ncbi:MAG: radical SAM protein [Acidobacteriota bacterium]
MSRVEIKVARADPSLPIFRLTLGGQPVLYAPGCVAASRDGDSLNGLREHARRAVEEWNRRAEAPFAPERLTVYLSNRCNLACPYCFAAAPAGRASRLIEEAAVHAAARLVARAAAAKGRPLQLILHGGGEPTLHWELMERLVAATRRIAADAGAGCYCFLATHGVLTDRQAQWLAANLDLIGLSCDGPPDIQNRQRPLASGAPSSSQVESTARVLAAAGARFSVRATITPETVERQAEIVAYLHQSLAATEMRFEPVYSVRSISQSPWRPEDAPLFVEHFLAAQREARAHGCDLQFAGVRPNELHGPYCDVLQDALHLLPDGTATACFFCVEAGDPLEVGCWDAAAGEFVLDAERIAAHRREVAAIPARCQDCVALYHCARECPEHCSRDSLHVSRAPGFRCLVNRLLAERWIMDAAQQVVDHA